MSKTKKAKTFEHSNKVLLDITKDIKKRWSESLSSNSNTNEPKKAQTKGKATDY